MEKTLRVQPDVKKIYLLLRASDTNSATDRKHNEVYIQPHVKLKITPLKMHVLWQRSNILLIYFFYLKIKIIGKELFRVLTEKLGPDFDSFLSEKVVAIPGDVTSENLGVKEFQLREEMFRNTNHT